MLASQARLFADHGYRVRVVVARGRSFDRRVRLVRVPELDSTWRENLRLRPLLMQGKIPAGYDKYEKRIRNALGRALSHCDVVIVHNMLVKALNFACNQALRELVADDHTGRKYINWAHDLDACAYDAPLMMRTSREFPWYLLNTPVPGVQNVTVSQTRQRELASLYRLPIGQVRVVPNSIDLGGFLGLAPWSRKLWQDEKLWEFEPVMLMPCRVVPKKNVELGLQLLGALKELGKKPKLIVTGPPSRHRATGGESYFARVKKLAEELSVSDDILFLYEMIGAFKKRKRQVAQAMMRDLYLLSDLALIVSREEGFGIPLLEAGALRVPVVCSSISVLKELAGTDALLLEPGRSPRQMARTIIAYMDRTPQHRFFKRVTKGYDEAIIFEKYIEPLLG